jgi:hypothetical protein
MSSPEISLIRGSTVRRISWRHPSADDLHSSARHKTCDVVTEISSVDFRWHATSERQKYPIWSRNASAASSTDDECWHLADFRWSSNAGEVELARIWSAAKLFEWRGFCVDPNKLKSITRKFDSFYIIPCELLITWFETIMARVFRRSICSRTATAKRV